MAEKIDGVAAANTLLGFGTWRKGYCLEAVWQAFKRVGARTGRSAATAYIGWQQSDGKHPGDRNPPAGVPVWWGPKASSNAGDVVISLGGGRVVATDWPHNGVINITTIAERERQIGRPYLGWTESIFDQKIEFSGSGGGGGAAPQWPARAKYGEAWVVEAQKKLVRLGYDIGADGADGKDGAATQAATKLLQERGGLDADGVFGPDTNAYADRLLAQGAGGTPPFPLPTSKWFGPEQGGDNSVSGWHGNREGLRQWQQKMIERGWDLGSDGADGYYGPKGSSSTDTYTGRTAKLFQAEKGLLVDGLIGPETWRMAWEAPVTPPTQPPVPPVVTPPPPTGTVLDPTAPWKSQTPDSALATWIGSPNYNNGSAPAATVKDWIVLHWFGSNADITGNDAHFQNPGEIRNGRGTNASSQYAVSADGRVHQYVKERDYAHTNGNTEANARSITIEHEGGPGKAITEATYLASARLIADIARRNKIAKLVWMTNVFPHKHFVATQCPGTLDAETLVGMANAILAEVVEPEEPESPTEGEELMARAEELLADTVEHLEKTQKFLAELVAYGKGA